jgi:hypothetical protein
MPVKQQTFNQPCPSHACTPSFTSLRLRPPLLCFASRPWPLPCLQRKGKGKDPLGDLLAATSRKRGGARSALAEKLLKECAIDQADIMFCRGPEGNLVQLGAGAYGQVGGWGVLGGKSCSRSERARSMRGSGRVGCSKEQGMRA